MELHKANKDEYEVLVDKYSARPLEEIMKVVPKWAYGNNINDLQDFDQHPEFGNYKVFLVELSKLIENTEFFDFNLDLLFTGKIESDYRVATTLERWENNKSVDPPTISINTNIDKKLSISDGRHRTKISYILKQKKIPIAIHKSLVERISKVIILEEPE